MEKIKVPWQEGAQKDRQVLELRLSLLLSLMLDNAVCLIFQVVAPFTSKLKIVIAQRNIFVAHPGGHLVMFIIELI